MADAEQTKVCPLCAETIKAAAKVCPYCRKSQRRWVFMTRYDLSAILVAMLFVEAVFLLCTILERKRDFALDREKVQVLNFHFALDKGESETNIIFFGVVTNKSEHAWEVGDYEIRYFDSRGNLVNMDRASSLITVFPHSDSSFRCDLLSSHNSIPDYAATKVTVVSAEDPRAPFNLFGD
jgi:hypothetical protein